MFILTFFRDKFFHFKIIRGAIFRKVQPKYGSDPFYDDPVQHLYHLKHHRPIIFRLFAFSWREKEFLVIKEEFQESKFLLIAHGRLLIEIRL